MKHAFIGQHRWSTQRRKCACTNVGIDRDILHVTKYYSIRSSGRTAGRERKRENGRDVRARFCAWAWNLVNDWYKVGAGTNINANEADVERLLWGKMRCASIQDGYIMHEIWLVVSCGERDGWASMVEYPAHLSRWSIWLWWCSIITASGYKIFQKRILHINYFIMRTFFMRQILPNTLKSIQSVDWKFKHIFRGKVLIGMSSKQYQNMKNVVFM